MVRISIIKERNPNWKGGKLINCPICGKSIWKKPSQIKKERLFCSRSCGYKGRNVHPKRGVIHPAWKGDKASYFVIHKWIRNNYGKAKICEYCKSTKNVHWANISHKYKRTIEDFMQLCKKCHVKYDMKNGWGDASKKYPNL